MSLREFHAGSSAGKTIPSRPRDIIMTVGTPSASDVVDVGDDGVFAFYRCNACSFWCFLYPSSQCGKVTDLAGWQTDITFDPALLEVVKVSEGDFLKTGGEGTFFLRGTIDNTAGKITQG